MDKIIQALGLYLTHLGKSEGKKREMSLAMHKMLKDSIRPFSRSLVEYLCRRIPEKDQEGFERIFAVEPRVTNWMRGLTYTDFEKLRNLDEEI